MEKKKRDKPGKPVTHPPVRVWETGDVFETYTEAAESTGCSRWGVMRTCEGVQQHSHGFHFVYDWESEGGLDWLLANG